MDMKKAETLAEVKATFEGIEENGDEWFSNLLARDDELTRWIEKGQVSVAATPTTALLLRQRYGCQRLYFANVKLGTLAEDLKSCLAGIPEKVITTVLEREGENQAIKNAICSATFSHYELLKYAMKINEPQSPSPQGLDFAQSTDAASIDAIIKENFDPLLDQNPDSDEIMDAIENKRVLVARDTENKQAVAFISVERIGKTLWSRYMATLQDYRKNAPYGALLLYQLLGLHSDAQRIVGWIRHDNAISRGMYQALGFQCDGLSTEEYFLYSAE